MLVLIHNPRCSKSRQAKEYLEEKGIDFEIENYIQNPLTETELKEVLKKLGIPAKDLIRTNEKVWKENFKDKPLSEAQLIKAMIEEPKLMQRPIIIKGDKAVIGRPTEKIEELL